MAELLLELFSEEIPARMQARAREDLARLLGDKLKAAGLDFGEIKIAPEKGGIRMKQGTGSVWRIRRDPTRPLGLLPPEQARVPFYPIQAGVVVAAVAGAVALGVAVIRRMRGRGRT